ncbi:MAG: signal peptide peptidase SppA [Candidatus Riflebacteria bacterium]|nr:signal peptide peptidase SppA [Candidatus Riflebacteria bacterium]
MGFVLRGLLLTSLLVLSATSLRAQGFFELLNPNAPKKSVSEEFYAGDPLAKPKVALLAIEGLILSQKMPIGGMTDLVETLRVQLAHAAKDPDLKGVLVEIDSPGGGITASEILYKALADFRGKGKHVVALMEDMAASGGYFVSLPAERILAHPTTITGSIGVLVKSVNVEGLYQKLGLKDTTLKSSATPLKDMLSSTRPMTEEERKVMQSLLDQMYDRFVDLVASHRKLTPEQARKLADGRVYSAREAKDLGLIDAIGFREDALAELYKLCGLAKEPKIVKYRKPFNLQDFFSAGSSFGGLRGPLLDRFASRGSAPQFMYLWEP